MKKVLSFSLLLTCIFCVQTKPLQSQIGEGIKELIKSPIPPSPNAAALGKFGEIPVGLSTGIPSIAVPVFDWQDKLKELSLSIGLSYHAGGHKVEDVASNCGLGWALNAGGAISRTVRGLPDDVIGGYLNTPALPNVTTQTNNGDFITTEGISSNIGLTLNNSSNFYTARFIAEGTLDGETDIFNINIGNIAAKFFLDKNGAVTFINQTNLAVTYERSSNPSNPYIYSFTVVDERGITYIFDVTEGTNVLSVDQVPGRPASYNISSFYISKIISADKKDSILFTYQIGNTVSNYGGFSDFWRITKRDDILQPSDYTRSFNTYERAPLRISQITFPDNTVASFAYTFAREDLYGDYALTDITVSNGISSRKHHLSYDYFYNSCDGCTPMNYTPNNEYKRLKLTQVQQISGAETIPPYVFEYNATSLPLRNSTWKDHWGYYGGTSSVDAVWPPVSTELDPSALMAPEFDPLEETTKAAILEKIIYPTGGYTQFTYHINDAYSTDFKLVAKGNCMELNYTIADYFVDLPFVDRNDANVFFSVQFHNNLPLPENEPWDENCPVTITIQSTDNTVTRTISGTYAVIPGTWLSLPTGKSYKIKFNTQCGWLLNYYFSISYRYGTVPRNRNIGGLRVEKTEDADNLGNIITTNYTYLATDGKSSGQINTLPVYKAYKTTTNHPYYEGVGPYMDFHWNRVATPTQTLSYFKGSPVIYTRVKVSKSTPTTNVGYSIHEFTSDQITQIQDDYYPYLQKPEADWQQGLPTTESYYNSSNQLVKTVSNEYGGTGVINDSAKARNLVAGLLLVKHKAPCPLMCMVLRHTTFFLVSYN